MSSRSLFAILLFIVANPCFAILSEDGNKGQIKDALALEGRYSREQLAALKLHDVWFQRIGLFHIMSMEFGRAWWAEIPNERPRIFVSRWSGPLELPPRRYKIYLQINEKGSLLLRSDWRGQWQRTPACDVLLRTGRPAPLPPKKASYFRGVPRS